jgi:tRNA dimethylallyltransferase
MSKPLLVIAGPTGSGKSSLAVQLALEFRGEIINCDSLQVYRQFDIGTAKIPFPDRNGIRHHLIDVAEAIQGFTAGDFQRLGREALSEISGRENLPIVAGGTGFYLRALIDGLSPAPFRDQQLRDRLAAREERRPGSLHRVLSRLDPPSAARIHFRDVPKLIRAIEIRIRSASCPSAPPPRDKLQGYRVRKLALFPPRDALYAALDQRCESMLADGLLNEVRGILRSGISREARPFESIGYKEAIAVVDGRMTLEAATEQMKRDTRRYAKRQMTWFRHEPGITVLEGFGDDPAIVGQAREWVLRLLD